MSASVKADLSTTAARRLADAVLAILERAGFDEQTSLLAYGAMFTDMVGQLDLDFADRADRDAAERPFDDRFAELITRGASGHRPTTDDLFDFGFDLLLAGLRHLRPADDGTA